MVSKKIIAAGLIAATALTAVPANAAGLNFQFGFGPGYNSHGWNQGPRHHDRHGPRWRHQRVSQWEVRSILRRHGFRGIRFVDTRGPVYQVRAWRRGHPFVLVVSARDGDILSRHRIRRHY